MDAEKEQHVQALLAEPVLARLATANPKTLQPHVVPVWFLWDGSSLWISAFVSTRKVKDLLKNPRCAVLIEPAAAQGQPASSRPAGRCRRADQRTRLPGRRDVRAHLHQIHGPGGRFSPRAAILEAATRRIAWSGSPLNGVWPGEAASLFSLP